MTTIAGSMLPALAGIADGRASQDATGAAAGGEQGEFAALLATLVAPQRPASTPEPVENGAATELEASSDDATAAADGDDLLAGVRGSGSQSTDDESRRGARDDEARAVAPPADMAADALVAASRAIAAAAPRSPEPVRTPESLDPEFREKLGRVLARMRELGHEVRVVETVRSQERQDRLFAQGRTTDGPVVTWTRRSRHTEGRAADVTIDGAFGGPAYGTLHRIAAEEGLRTLGARDPGHLELARSRGADAPVLAQAPSHSSSSSPSSPAVPRTVAPLTPPASPALGQLAQVAHVARVAQVAEVATVARVAQVGGGGGARVAPPAVAPRRARASEDASTGTETRRDETSARAEAMTGLLGGPRTGGAFGAALAEVAGLVRPAGDAQLGRVDRVLAMQEAVRGRPLHELTLALDGADGVGRIQVGVSGRAVGAVIETADAASAAQMGARLDDLTRALERAGLEPEAIRVSSTEGRDIARDLAGREIARAGVTTGGESGRAATDRQQQDTGARDRDAWARDERRQQQGGRHRSRREQQETTE